MRIFVFMLIASMLWACSNKPKVIEGRSLTEQTQAASEIFSTNEKSEIAPLVVTNPLPGEKKVVEVLEVLPTSRYVYLKVASDKESYWIATRKQEVKVGQRFSYSDGLLKTNFESKEHNRVFDKVYLVSSLQPIGGKDVAQPEGVFTPKEKGVQKDPQTITIAQIIEQAEQLEGETILVKGRCTKVNARIMGRNWIHLKDGTADAFDLVITSNDFVHEGGEVTMRATVSRNVDFGAGYRYELILENGSLLQ